MLLRICIYVPCTSVENICCHYVPRLEERYGLYRTLLRKITTAISVRRDSWLSIPSWDKDSIHVRLRVHITVTPHSHQFSNSRVDVVDAEVYPFGFHRLFN